jgi:pimeloyl-ACP methyl ester carboxylesterase
MVIWDLLGRYPARLRTVTLVSPGSPFGFGATRGPDGTPTTPDFAGSGAGLINPELVKRIGEGDRGLDSPFSPRAAIRTVILKPPFIAPREEEWLSGMLATHLGEQDYPGDFVPSANWPYRGPGVWGPNNATSPKYQPPVARIIQAEPKPPILWLRGSADMLVSDASFSDPGNLGRMGLLPGWPGEEAYPPQPMLGQTRAVLEQYAANGGRYQEVIIQDAGHAPYAEQPAEFNRHFFAHLEEEGESGVASSE